MSVNDDYSSSYENVGVHKLMLQDVVRTEAYERALMTTVGEGDTVLDFGCGTGILSIFAARAGARKVYAADQSAFISYAKAIAEKNDLHNIEFHHDDHLNLDIGEKVDVLVSEWMGHFLFYEDMLNPLLRLRDRFLKEGGAMVPRTVTLWADLVTDEYLFEDCSFLRNNPYGVDLSPIADLPFTQISLEEFLPGQLLGAPCELARLDLSTLEESPAFLFGSITPAADNTVYGIAGWFDAALTEDIDLKTGPNDAPTHWRQIFFPFPEPVELFAGRKVDLKISLPPEGAPQETCWGWSFDDGSTRFTASDEEGMRALAQKPPRGRI